MKARERIDKTQEGRPMSYPLIKGSICVLTWCVCHVGACGPGPQLQAVEHLEAQGTELSDGH